MRLTYISEGSKELGMGHIMHQAVVMERLKWRALESKRDLCIIDSLVPTLGMAMAGCGDKPKLVLFNCLKPKEQRLADIVVTPDVSPKFKNKVTRKKGWVHFAGPRYWFLRSQFLKPLGRANPRHIGMMIGGTDPLRLGEKIKALLPEVKVIQGEHISYQMRQCRLMLTGCGQSFWESLAVGTPAIPFAANEAQAKQYGSVFRLGKVDDIRGMIERREWVNPDPAYEIGRGWQEVIEEIIR